MISHCPSDTLHPKTGGGPAGKKETRTGGEKGEKENENTHPQEEVPRPQQQRHRLRGHDGEILRAGEVRDAERVPEHDVRVGNVLRRVLGDPGGDALGGLAGRLGHVASRGVELRVGV